MGAGRAGVGQEAQGVERLVDPEVGRLQDALQVGRDQEGVVGRRRRSTSSAVAASKRLRMANDPPESSVPVAKRTETVWYIGEHTMWRSSPSKCQTAASSSKTAFAVPRPRCPVVTPLGRPVVPEV
jgi:hypothetical protein